MNCTTDLGLQNARYFVIWTFSIVLYANFLVYLCIQSYWHKLLNVIVFRNTKFELQLEECIGNETPY